jgi:putative oxygen-independent coproporphyrinogen III oxidase
MTSAQRTQAQAARGLYLHLPFCQHKCTYCDFTVRVLQERGQITRYLDHLEQELTVLSTLPHQLETLYVGGGTPSLLSTAELERLWLCLSKNWDLSQIQEWTFEVNPETGSIAYFKACRQAGVNRISLGVQSFQTEELKACGRSHDPQDIQRCVAELRQSGFENISLDLIYGLPGQNLNSWKNTLEQALALQPQHLSLYSLEVHEKTAMGWQERKNRLQRPAEEAEVAMYEMACRILAGAGFEHYEIANWSLPGRASQHNRLYWLAAPVLAAGVGAHGYWQERRYENSDSLRTYYQNCQAKDWSWLNTPQQSPQEAAAERVILGLRLLQEGLDGQAFKQDFGIDLSEAYAQVLPALLQDGWVKWQGQHLCLSPEAVLISNAVFSQLLEPQLEG